MSKTTITYIVVAFCGVFGVAAFAAFIVAPAWSAYEKAWQRVTCGPRRSTSWPACWSSERGFSARRGPFVGPRF